MLLTVATPQFEKPSQRHIGPISLVFGILMYLRNEHLSAYQRTVTLALTKGGLNEQVDFFFQNIAYIILNYIAYDCEILSYNEPSTTKIFQSINKEAHKYEKKTQMISKNKKLQEM